MAQLNVELIVRQGTAEEWGGSSYVLKSGEWGYDTTNKIIKIGDGTSLWAALTAVSMTDTNTTYTFAEGSENGTFIVTPSTGGPITVSIHGLGSAAYTDSSAYATAAQGVKADSAYQKPANGIPATDLAAAVQAAITAAGTALQADDITEGSTNGTIAVGGEDVAVHGLGSAAYTESSAYDAAGAASGAVGAHNTAPDAHADIRSQVTALAEKVSGRATAYVYQNKSDEDYTTAIGKAGSFVVGDTIYFLDADIPDEWVTAVNDASPFYTFQEIETESPSFDGYVTGTGLTADKIVLGNAGSAVKASVYGIVTTLTASDNANVATSKAVADYVASLGYQTAANVNSLIQAATIQGSKVSGAVAEAAGYTEDGAIAIALEGKEDAGTAAALIATLDKPDSAVANQYVTAVSEEDGIITVTRKQIQYSEISNTPSIPVLPDNIVETIQSGNDSIAVNNQDGDVTITHKAYSTGVVSVTADQPYYIDSITVERGHVTSATAKSLASALAELGTLTLNGGKADGTY